MKSMIVVPCYNERDRLPVFNFNEFIERSNSIVFLFVNDGSTDDTLVLLEEIHATYPEKVKVLNLEHNQGKAEAVRQGINFCFTLEPEIVGFWDADLATPLSAILHLLEIYNELPHIRWVFGSRVKLLGRKINRRDTRHYIGRMFATFTSIVLDLPVYDTQCGAKLFKVDDYLKRIFNKQFISKWIFDVELIARLKVLSSQSELPKRIIYEYPLREWTDVSGSKLKLTDFFIASYDLIKIWQYIQNKKSTNTSKIF